jgi:hypothetical protein
MSFAVKQNLQTMGAIHQSLDGVTPDHAEIV